MEGKGWVSRHQLYQTGKINDNGFFCLNATCLLIRGNQLRETKRTREMLTSYCLLAFSKIVLYV